MARTKDDIRWCCPECGYGRPAPFGTIPFGDGDACPACGYPFSAADVAEAYVAARAAACAGAYADWARTPFPDGPVPAEAAALFERFVPGAASFTRWSDFTLFDVLWIIRRKAGPIEEFPLRTISPADWATLSEDCRNPLFAFAGAVRRGDADAVLGAVQDANGADLPRLERILSELSWSIWPRGTDRRLARALADAAERLDRPDAVDSFSASTRLRLLRKRRNSDAAQDLPADLPPGDILFAIREGLADAGRFNFPPPEAWSDAEGGELLSLPAVVLPDGFANALVARWNDRGWPEERLAEVVRNRPETLASVSNLPSDVLSRLLARSPDLAPAYAANGLFPRIAAAHWSELLARPGVASRPEVRDYASASVLPVLSSEALGSLLSENPRIADCLRPSDFTRISPTDFLRLCREDRATKALVEAYPVECLALEDQIELVRKFPWARDRIPWRSWPMRDVLRLLDEKPSLEGAYPDPGRLAAARFRRRLVRLVRKLFRFLVKLLEFLGALAFLGLMFAVKNWKVSLVVVTVLWFASC